MLPFRSILCPVDFSPHAAAALGQAATIADAAGATLSVAWVTDPLLAQAAVVYGLDPKGEQARADLREFVSRHLPAERRQHPPALVTAAGSPSEQILRAAADRRADLIVMGTHGLSGYRKAFFGSTTERVLRRTTVPVLAVPLAPAGSSSLSALPALVLVAIDLEPDSHGLAAYAARLVREMAARAILVHVTPSEAAVPTQWREAAASHRMTALDTARVSLARLGEEAGFESAEVIVAAGHAAEEIAAAAIDRRVDLIVMGLHRTGMTAPGSIAYRVLVLAPSPVLVVPPGRPV